MSRLCECGCGETLGNERRPDAIYATEACGTRAYRARREQARVTARSARGQTQVARVDAALVLNPGGICQADFLPPNVLDGGRPIGRLAARVKDLRDQGREIATDGMRQGYAVYKLAENVAPAGLSAVVTPPAPSEPVAAGDQLAFGVAA